MRILICDDNEQELTFYEEKLRQLANRHEQKMDLRRFKSGNEMLFYLEDHMETTDAIYLDINMPSIDGVEVAKKLRQRKFEGEIIFLTVSKKHFLPAFDVHAFNYIIKNETTDKRFESIFKNIIKLVDDKKKEYIMLSAGGEHKRIPIDSIHYFEVRRRIVTVYYDDNKTFEFFSSMDNVEVQLYDRGFLRINRAFLVAVDAIETVTYDRITMLNGADISIGRTYQKQVREFFKGPKERAADKKGEKDEDK